MPSIPKFVEEADDKKFYILLTHDMFTGYVSQILAHNLHYNYDDTMCGWYQISYWDSDEKFDPTSFTIEFYELYIRNDTDFDILKNILSTTYVISMEIMIDNKSHTIYTSNEAFLEKFETLKPILAMNIMSLKIHYSFDAWNIEGQIK